MDRTALERSWRITREHLEAARNQLPANLASGAEGATVADYEHYLEHNELELALDELADIGYTNAPPPEFWRSLIRAAENMSLNDRISLYEQELRKNEA